MRNVPSAGALPTDRSAFFERCLAYLLGLLSAQNIFYLFQLSSTYFNVILPVGFLAALYCLWRRRDSWQSLRVLFDFGLQGYLATILLSSLSFLVLLRQNENVSSRSYLNGLISLFLLFCIYYAVFALRAHKEWLLRGIVHGFILNLIFSVIQLVFYELGPGFTLLYNLFPEEGFFVSLKWQYAVQHPELPCAIIYYRAQGLFAECSHLLAFSALFGLFAFSRMNKWLRWPLFALMLYLYTVSLSGNLLIVLSVFALYAALRLFVRRRGAKSYDPDARRRIALKVAVGCAVAIGILLLAIYVFADRLRELFDDFFASLQTSNLLDSENVARMRSIRNSFEAFLQKPFGVGYNMSPTYLNSLYGVRTKTALSAPLTLLLETGPLGFFFYYLFLLYPVIRLLRLPLNRDRAILLAGFVGLFLVQIGNGTLGTPYIWVFFALARMEIAAAEETPGEPKRGAFRKREVSAGQRVQPLP